MEKLDLKNMENLPLNNFNAQEKIKNTLSTMNIGVYAGKNPEKIVAAITGIMENHGFSCTKQLENELFFQNESHHIHIVLLDKESQIDGKEPSLETNEIFSIAEYLMGKFPTVVEPSKIIFPSKTKKKTYNYNHKTTRIKKTNEYNKLKHTKCARNQKNSGRNFRKGNKSG